MLNTDDIDEHRLSILEPQFRYLWFINHIENLQVGSLNTFKSIGAPSGGSGKGFIMWLTYFQ